MLRKKNCTKCTQAKIILEDYAKMIREVDAESKEGVDLRSKYEINSAPFFIIDNNGEELLESSVMKVWKLFQAD